VRHRRLRNNVVQPGAGAGENSAGVGLEVGGKAPYASIPGHKKEKN